MDRFCRVVLPGPDFADRGIAYVFLIMAYPTHLNLAGGYEQYRETRINMLQAYCLNVFSKNRHLKRLVGIAVDASHEVTGRQGVRRIFWLWKSRNGPKGLNSRRVT